MKTFITPARNIRGRVKVPGDKSISHRLAMLGAIAEGKTSIENFATSQDCQSTLSCLRLLGTSVTIRQPNSVVILGKGLRGLNAASTVLDAGNSGSTIRMLSGILSGQEFVSRISGDESLCRRPMKRIIDPLTQMGAKVQAIKGNYPPLLIIGAPLKAIQYTLPVASAQVKSAVLLAGLYADGETEVIEPHPTRNHTELALKEFQGVIRVSGDRISLKGWQRLEGINTEVPGDISSAAFFVVAATLLPGSEVLLEEIGLNPSRRAIVDLLKRMGASIEIVDQRVQSGETKGDLLVKTAPLKGGLISKEQVPQLIDEIPILAVMATRTQEGLEIRDAGELRVKESDRISSIARNLRAFGAHVEEFADGMFVPGRQSLRGSLVDAFGDHRIAMAFAIAGLLASGETCIEGSECVSVSFPNFFEILDSLTVR
jgi:3-phosphoshikimate 1-carboxyvinyltransferase